MNLNYIDLHCDTAFELFHKKQNLTGNDLAISLDKAAAYQRYAQFFAVWGSYKRTDEQIFDDFIAVSDHFDRLIAENEGICRVRTAQELGAAWKENKAAAILAVEDARLLAGKLERLDELAARGVKYLTLMWAGESCIGGAHDTEAGLTDFGRAVVKRCFELGIIPDISHASAKSADDVLTLAEEAGRPVIASHSNAYAVWDHSRNLRDEHFKRLIALGGIVGLNLCAHHVRDCKTAYARPEDMLAHIEHFLSLGGEDHIAMGGDLDGASLPEGMKTVADVSILADRMAERGYSDALIQKIFYQNALHFIEHHIGTASVGQ
ncbi:MAG: membrane dipeptidase [Clostridia bacterium]|nr:membrane dipeptidase [Clostridia bacterium]